MKELFFKVTEKGFESRSTTRSNSSTAKVVIGTNIDKLDAKTLFK